MDAFAISIALGLSAGKTGLKETLIPGIYFGFFQALMPLLGFLGGTFFAAKIQNMDHWIAFVLLGFIGGKMIKDSFAKDEDTVNENPFQFVKMLVLAVATSIDALAVGITYAFFEVNIIAAIIITGITTFTISTAGVLVGRKFGAKFKSKAEFAGGAVLVILGIKVLVEHLFLSAV